MSHWKRALADPLKRQAPTAACCRIAKVKSHRSDARGGNAQMSSLVYRNNPTALRSFSRIVRDATQRHTATASSSRPFSSEGGEGTDALSECAESIKQMGESEMALQVARLLSPSARKEVSDAVKRVVSSDASSQDPPSAEESSPKDSSADTSEEVPKPTRRDLELIALNQAIPFVGFGIMDNAILILAGDAIDNYFGVMFGISTLCAAALGNIVSDVAGVGLGTLIEDYCSKLGIPQPNLTQAQRQLRSVRFSGQFGCAFGLIVGCVIGMFPLLFLDPEKIDKAKHNAHMDDIFNCMVTEAKELVGAEHTCLFLVVDKEHDSSPAVFSRREERREGYLYGKYLDGSTDASVPTHSHIPLGKGVVSHAALSGELVNIYDARKEADYSYSRDILQAIPPELVKHIVCVPVLDVHGNVIAVIQAINKISDGSVPYKNGERASKGGGFTLDDIRTLRALATRISINFENMREEEHKVHIRDTIQILKEHGASELDDYYATHTHHLSRRLFTDKQENGG